MYNLSEREKQIIESALFHFFLYVRDNPDSEYVRESNGLLHDEFDEPDYDYSEKEIDDLYCKIAYADICEGVEQ